MAKKIQGQKTPVRQGDGWTFSPETGWISQTQYIGETKEVKALAGSLAKSKKNPATGAPAALNLTITPLGNGLASLDVAADDSSTAGTETTTWDLQSSDYEKDIWTHPVLRALYNECPTEYAWLRENLPIIKEKGTWDAVEGAWNCTTSAANAYSVKFQGVLHFHQAVAPPTGTGTGSASSMETILKVPFTEGSTWVDTVANTAWVATAPWPTLGWTQISSKCCLNAKAIFGIFRDGVESFITTNHVLRQSVVRATNTGVNYAITNTNRIHTWEQMKTLCAVPQGLEFALPQTGEWLKKAPQIQYEGTKMSISTEWWHSDDWNNILYERAQ